METNLAQPEVDAAFEAIIAQEFAKGVTEIAEAPIDGSVLQDLEGKMAEKIGPKQDAGYGGRWGQ